MHKLKSLLAACLIITLIIPGHLTSLNKQSRLTWNSIFLETPETYAIAELLQVYETYDTNGSIQLRRIGNHRGDGGYLIPEIAMQKADVVIGYGIASDISFEDSASELYGKPSYGFDCTCSRIRPRQRNCHFIPSCIVPNGSVDPFPLYGSFDQHLEMIGAIGKKIFVKMDIEGNEYGTIPDILEYAFDITGMVLEIHFTESNQIPKALHLMQMLDKHFLLIHVHGNNCCKDAFVTSNSLGEITRVLELSYINRNLVQNYNIASNQTHPTSLDIANSSISPDVEFTIFY